MFDVAGLGVCALRPVVVAVMTGGGLGRRFTPIRTAYLRHTC